MKILVTGGLGFIGSHVVVKLQEEGFEFEKVEVEYAVYDTNVTHDAKWILGYEVA